MKFRGGRALAPTIVNIMTVLYNVQDMNEIQNNDRNNIV